MWRAYNMARASVLEPNSGNFGGVSQDVVPGVTAPTHCNAINTLPDSGDCVLLLCSPITSNPA